ncbi:hypothetical protein ACWDR3_44550 [Streptomyces sp. NPDC001002]
MNAHEDELLVGEHGLHAAESDRPRTSIPVMPARASDPSTWPSIHAEQLFNAGAEQLFNSARRGRQAQ